MKSTGRIILKDIDDRIRHASAELYRESVEDGNEIINISDPEDFISRYNILSGITGNELLDVYKYVTGKRKLEPQRGREYVEFAKGIISEHVSRIYQEVSNRLRVGEESAETQQDDAGERYFDIIKDELTRLLFDALYTNVDVNSTVVPHIEINEAIEIAAEESGVKYNDIISDVFKPVLDYVKKLRVRGKRGYDTVVVSARDKKSQGAGIPDDGDIYIVNLQRYNDPVRLQEVKERVNVDTARQQDVNEQHREQFPQWISKNIPAWVPLSVLQAVYKRVYGADVTGVSLGRSLYVRYQSRKEFISDVPVPYVMSSSPGEANGNNPVFQDPSIQEYVQRDQRHQQIEDEEFQSYIDAYNQNKVENDMNVVRSLMSEGSKVKKLQTIVNTLSQGKTGYDTMKIVMDATGTSNYYRKSVELHRQIYRSIDVPMILSKLQSIGFVSRVRDSYTLNSGAAPLAHSFQRLCKLFGLI